MVIFKDVRSSNMMLARFHGTGEIVFLALDCIGVFIGIGGSFGQLPNDIRKICYELPAGGLE